MIKQSLTNMKIYVNLCILMGAVAFKWGKNAEDRFDSHCNDRSFLTHIAEAAVLPCCVGRSVSQ